MGKEQNLGLTPVYSDVLKELFRGNPENPTTVDYKKVRIANGGDLSLSGFLVGSSIAIPIHPPQNSEGFIQEVVDENWQTYLSLGEESITGAFFHFLKTPINTAKMGFDTHLTEIKGAFLIHIFPDAHFDTQEDFVKAFTEAYKSEGFDVSIENPSS
jgi:hypothetical protein